MGCGNHADLVTGLQLTGYKERRSIGKFASLEEEGEKERYPRKGSFANAQKQPQKYQYRVRSSHCLE